MLFGLLHNPMKDPHGLILNRIRHHLTYRGVQTVVQTDLQTAPNVIDDQFAKSELIISLGGDGTFLQAAHLAYALNCPVIGINLGSLGFLAEIPVDDIESDLDRLIDGKMVQSFRMLLEIQIRKAKEASDQSYFALNDVVLTRGASHRILPVELYLDQAFIEVVPSDGVMVSTPTGSTGYAMAAGGPILEPTLELMQFTPICPHSLHNRSYIFAPHQEVMLTLSQYPCEATVMIDGKHDIRVCRADQIIIKKAKSPLKMPKLRSSAFFHDLPAKIHGRGVAR